MIIELWNASSYIQLQSDVAIKDGIMNEGFGMFASKLSGRVIEGNINQDQVYKAIYNGQFLGIFKPDLRVETDGEITESLNNIFEEFTKLGLKDQPNGTLLEDNPFGQNSVTVIMPRDHLEGEFVQPGYSSINVEELNSDVLQLRAMLDGETITTFYKSLEIGDGFDEKEADKNKRRSIIPQDMSKGYIGFKASEILNIIFGNIESSLKIKITNDVPAEDPLLGHGGIDDYYYGVEYADAKFGGMNEKDVQAECLVAETGDTAYNWTDIEWPLLPGKYIVKFQATAVIINPPGPSRELRLYIRHKDSTSGDSLAEAVIPFDGSVKTFYPKKNVKVDANKKFQFAVRSPNGYNKKVLVQAVFGINENEANSVIPYSTIKGDMPFDETFRAFRWLYNINLELQNDDIHCVKVVPKSHEIPNYIPYKIEEKTGSLVVGEIGKSKRKIEKHLLKDVKRFFIFRNDQAHKNFYLAMYKSWPEDNNQVADAVQPYYYTQDTNTADVKSANVITFETDDHISVGDTIYISNEVLKTVVGKVVSIEETDDRRKITAYSIQ